MNIDVQICLKGIDCDSLHENIIVSTVVFKRFLGEIYF